ncbi:MAG: phytoene desaturase family protein [Candidatus Jordarchaeum sp.]|uniref:phytoene desaturase family protein n=1 Tax=Candidatus Jordarchaeum sp. TaxID=2823881 RepID=UPI00404B9322
MSEKYDVVVIGAGLGGLTSAASLAKNDLSVLLLDKHYKPGGYATSFVRGRFEFEVALHALSGLDLDTKRGFMWRMFEDLGITKRVQFVKLPTLYKSIYPDFEFVMPAGRENIENVLLDTFPKESEGIIRFLDKIQATNNILTGLQRGSGITKEEIQEHFVKYKDKTLGEVLEADVKDIKARAILAQLTGYFGLPPSKVSYVLAASGLDTYFRYGGAQIKGTSHTLANAFVDSIYEFGGEVRLSNGAKKILTEGGKVTGVITDKDERIETDYIISNANPFAVCNLIGFDKVPKSFVERLESKPIAIATSCAYLGLDVPHTELGVDEFEMFLGSSYDFDRLYNLRDSLEPTEIGFATYNLAYSDASPPGTSVVVLTTIANGEVWRKLKPSEYFDAKTRVGERMLKIAEERVVPGLREHIEVVEISTPITNMRYTGNPDGTILGTPYTPDNILGNRLPQDGPFKGLYFTGAWTQIGGGYQTCLMSGSWAASKVLNEIKGKK